VNCFLEVTEITRCFYVVTADVSVTDSNILSQSTRVTDGQTNRITIPGTTLASLRRAVKISRECLFDPSIRAGISYHDCFVQECSYPLMATV